MFFPFILLEKRLGSCLCVPVYLVQNPNFFLQIPLDGSPYQPGQAKLRLGSDKKHLKQYIPLPYPQVCAATDRLSVARVLERRGAEPAGAPRPHLLLRRLLLRPRPTVAQVQQRGQNYAEAKLGPHLHIWDARSFPDVRL